MSHGGAGAPWPAPQSSGCHACVFQVQLLLCCLQINTTFSVFLSSPQFYLQARFTWKGARLLRPLLQFTLVMMAFYTGLSRVSDHKHHPTDVLAGFAQGALVAYCVVSAANCARDAGGGPGGNGGQLPNPRCCQLTSAAVTAGDGAAGSVLRGLGPASPSRDSAGKARFQLDRGSSRAPYQPEDGHAAKEAAPTGASPPREQCRCRAGGVKQALSPLNKQHAQRKMQRLGVFSPSALSSGRLLGKGPLTQARREGVRTRESSSPATVANEHWLICKPFPRDASGESGAVGIMAFPCTIQPKAVSWEREPVSARRGGAGCLAWWWVFNAAKGLVRKRRTKAVPARLRLPGLFSCNLLSEE